MYIYKPGEKDQAKSFAFDYVFGSETPQQHIYEQTAFSLVDSVLDGYNGTIFAYGQTGNVLFKNRLRKDIHNDGSASEC